jgi:hypothetical protein
MENMRANITEPKIHVSSRFSLTLRTEINRVTGEELRNLYQKIVF